VSAQQLTPRKQGEENPKSPSEVDREVEKVLRRAQTWNDIADAAYRHAERGRITVALALYRKGEQLYPEHAKDFTTLSGLALGNHLRTARAEGYP
jgi:hypothetical protein